jgi:hypothetical protein
MRVKRHKNIHKLKHNFMNIIVNRTRLKDSIT